MLEKKHIEFREKVRSFAREHIEPKAIELDSEQKFPDEHMEPLTRMGYLSLLIPENYGGSKIDTLSYSIAVEEISRVCGSTGIIVSAHNSLGTGPIINFGTPKQKEKFLPRAARGELMAFGLSEPDAGSDAGGTRTLATKKDNHWLVNGSKCWITSAPQAFATVATAKTSDDPSDKRITTFVFERDFKGYSVSKKENKLGLRGSDTSFLHFDDFFTIHASLVCTFCRMFFISKSITVCRIY